MITFLLESASFCLESFSRSILKGIGSLVALVGLGQIVAGYLYPNTSEEITSVVDEFEKR